MKKKLLLLISGVACLAVAAPVLANGHTDSNWGDTVPLGKVNHYTAPQWKYETTPGYITLSSGSQAGAVNAWMQLHNGVEVNSPKTKVNRGSYAKVHGDAHELYGNVRVRMAIENNAWRPYSETAYGVWSPDSY